MRGDDRCHAEIDRDPGDLGFEFAVKPGRADRDGGVCFKLVRNIYQRTSGRFRIRPILPGRWPIASEEYNVAAFEAASRDVLDERSFVADRLELALRGFVVQEGDVGGRKIALVENVFHLFA